MSSIAGGSCKNSRLENDNTNGNPYCVYTLPLLFHSCSYQETGKVMTWLQSQTKARFLAPKKKLEVYKSLKKRYTCVSGIWSCKFYNPNNLEKWNQKY